MIHDIEKAIRFLAAHMPHEEKKPVLMHSIAVGMRLYDMGQSRAVVLGGFLHDVVEDAPLEHGITPDVIQEEFGDDVARIVAANTKNQTLATGAEKRADIVARCVAVGPDACIVKAADIVENFLYYERTGNVAEITGHCVPFAQELLDKARDVLPDALCRQLRAC